MVLQLLRIERWAARRSDPFADDKTAILGQISWSPYGDCLVVLVSRRRILGVSGFPLGATDPVKRRQRLEVFKNKMTPGNFATLNRFAIINYHVLPRR